MKSGAPRLVYELVFWSVVAALAYVNRGLYQSTVALIEPIFQAYTPVAILLLSIALVLAITYLREAIAQTTVLVFQHLSGREQFDLDKGNLQKNIQKSASRMLRKGDFQGAGEAYESLEMWRDAALVYEKGNIYGRAASAWKNSGNVSKAIEFYEKDSNYEDAAKICLNEGMQDRAAKNFRIAGDMYLKENQFAMAAEMYEQAHDYNKAGNIYEEARKLEKALACYEKAGDAQKIQAIVGKIHPSDFHRRGADFTRLIQRSAEVLAVNGYPLEAAKILEECQDLIRAAEISASCNLWDKAAEMYLKADRNDLAEVAIAKIEDKRVAADILARVAVNKEEWQIAGDRFLEAGKQNQAIDAYKKIRNFDAAARIYEEMGRFIMAGEMYSSGKSLIMAANAYAKAYDWRNAAECFEAGSDLAQAIEAYANAGNYLKAGILAIKVTDYARAIEYLQRIPAGSPDFHMGTAFLATAFYYQGHYDMSTELFTRVMDTLSLSRDTLPVYYAFALNMETHNPKKSLGLMRQILGIDIHYSDVADRARKLEQHITSLSTGHGAQTPMPANGSYSQQTPLTDNYNWSGGERPDAAGTSASHKVSTPIRSITQSLPRSPSTIADIHSALLDSRYQLKESITQGSRITDFEGFDTIAKKPVMVRTFPRPDNQTEYQNTMENLKAASQLDYDGINPIQQFGETQGMIYCVSAKLPGLNLRQWIRSNGPMSISDLRQYMGQLLNDLAYAHEKNISHQNLRPELITMPDNPTDHLILSGFGSPSRQPVSAESVYLTVPDSDPQFLAPEQIVGAEVDERTDIYAVGLILFFALTGRTPFEVKRINDTQEIARMQVQVALTRPSAIRATLPSSVDDIFLKCVSKAPATRYQTVQELHSDLSNLVTHTGT